MEHPLPRPADATSNRLLFRFLAVATLVYLGWSFGYEQWLTPDGRLDTALCTQITAASAAALQAVGFTAAVAPWCRPCC